MLRPSSEGPGRLSYRPGPRGSRLSLFHVRLTDAALQALLAHLRLQGAPRPVIAFRGSQGYLRIPRAPAGSPGPRSCLFTFYLSRCSREQPQASFDCVRQSASRLESEGVIRERLTFCATAEAPSWKRPLPPAERGSRGGALAATAAALPRQDKGLSRPAERTETAAAASREVLAGEEPRAVGPLLARLLALQPHRKAELLGQAGLDLQARLQVLAALEQVGQLEPRASRNEELMRGRAQEAGRLPTARFRRRGRPAPHVGSPSRRSGRSLRTALEPRATRWQGPGFPGAESSWWGRKVEVTPEKRRRPCSFPGSEKVVGESEAEADKQGEAQLSAAAGGHCPAGPPETPTYSLIDGPIRSAQQCQAYREAFSAGYAEYRPLHARIERVSRRFAQLGNRIRELPPGTRHYQLLESQILQEYRQFKQMYPDYQQEKQRCQYLHQELARIKEQILSFEQNMAAAEPGGR